MLDLQKIFAIALLSILDNFEVAKSKRIASLTGRELSSETKEKMSAAKRVRVTILHGNGGRNELPSLPMTINRA
jgi:hypothetical protein